MIHLLSFVVLPELTNDGVLPPGVHIAERPEFESRFGGSSPRRLWLTGRLRTILELAAAADDCAVFSFGVVLSPQSPPQRSRHPPDHERGF
jgi:hypothetical protein